MKEPKVKVLSPWQTLVIGVIFTLLMLLVGWSILLFTGTVNFFTGVGITSLTLCVSGLGLINNSIKTAHAGVLMFLGKRIYTHLLSEGNHWILPFMFSFQEVDMSERASKVKDLEFPVGRVTTQEDVDRGIAPASGVFWVTPFILSATVLWRVNNPAIYLDIGDDGDDQIMESLRHQMIDALRELGRRYLPTDFYGIEREALQEGMGGIFKRDLEDDEDILERWGIKIHNISMPRVQPKNPEVVAAFESVVREAREKLGEEIAVKHVSAMVKHIMDVTGCSFDQAILAYQRQTGDLPSHEIIITGSDNSSIVASAAMLANNRLIDQDKAKKDRKGGSQ